MDAPSGRNPLVLADRIAGVVFACVVVASFVIGLRMLLVGFERTAEAHGPHFELWILTQVFASLVSLVVAIGLYHGRTWAFVLGVLWAARWLTTMLGDPGLFASGWMALGFLVGVLIFAWCGLRLTGVLGSRDVSLFPHRGGPAVIADMIVGTLMVVAAVIAGGMAIRSSLALFLNAPPSGLGVNALYWLGSPLQTLMTIYVAVGVCRSQRWAFAIRLISAASAIATSLMQLSTGYTTIWPWVSTGAECFFLLWCVWGLCRTSNLATIHPFPRRDASLYTDP